MPWRRLQESRAQAQGPLVIFCHTYYLTTYHNELSPIGYELRGIYAQSIPKYSLRLFSPIINQSVRDQLAVAENENTFFIGTRRYNESERDRLEYDRADILAQCLDAWRESPLARRIVELTSQYVVGPGFDIKCDDEPTRTFIDQFWHHRLNRMPSRVIEMCDELTRTGNLFLLVSTDQSGMSFVRAVPAADIDLITPSVNDIEQPVSFTTKADEHLQVFSYPAYHQESDAPNPDGSFPPVMLHYAINRPAGAQWGEPDLAPLLRWLRRYSAWLEDRVRLNRFRNAFLYVVTSHFGSEEARRARQVQLAANPPSPGSILVCDESETWSVISPKLEALDAMQDGLAIKKLIRFRGGDSDALFGGAGGVEPHHRRKRRRSDLQAI